MKGLLIKDLKLILKQKSIFIIWLAMALFILIANQDPVFGISYSMFLMVIMLTGTISYDDAENGMGFLMTLPVSRKMYAIEKYILIIGGTAITGMFITLCSVIYLLANPGIMPIDAILLTAVILFLITVLFTSIYLPFQLKYGAEKSRIILLVFAGGIVVLMFLVRRMGDVLQSWLGDFLTTFAVSVGSFPAVIAAGSLLIMGIAVGLSIKISINIQKKEEY